MRFAILSFAALTALAAAPARGADDDHPVVVLDTTVGPITVELDRAKAPITVDNFLKYVDKGFYDGLVFHRVIPRLHDPGGRVHRDQRHAVEKREGGPAADQERVGQRPEQRPRARSRWPGRRDPNSATSQFFINLVDNSRLDNAGGGYAVFGKVIDGMDVVDAIAKVETDDQARRRRQPHEDVPVKPIIIKSAKRKSKA